MNIDIRDIAAVMDSLSFEVKGSLSKIN